MSDFARLLEAAKAEVADQAAYIGELEALLTANDIPLPPRSAPAEGEEAPPPPTPGEEQAFQAILGVPPERPTDLGGVPVEPEPAAA